jgi:hypothetical protein
MPVPIDEFWEPKKSLEPGDVLMVARKMYDDARRKPFTWRYFFVITSHQAFAAWAKGLVVGADNPRLKDKEVSVQLDDEDWGVVHYLPPDEWPDGVHAFRMAMVLKGLIPEIV